MLNNSAIADVAVAATAAAAGKCQRIVNIFVYIFSCSNYPYCFSVCLHLGNFDDHTIYEHEAHTQQQSDAAFVLFWVNVCGEPEIDGVECELGSNKRILLSWYARKTAEQPNVKWKWYTHTQNEWYQRTTSDNIVHKWIEANETGKLYTTSKPNRPMLPWRVDDNNHAINYNLGKYAQ